MSTVQNYLDRFGGNFIIAAFIPALAFMSAIMIFIGPTLPSEFWILVQSDKNPLSEPGLFLILCTVILGFTLSSLNTYIYKLFEGYIFLYRIPGLAKGKIAKARKLNKRFEALKQKIKILESTMDLENEKDYPRLNRRISELKEERDAIASEYDASFPPTLSKILPTRFGNILRSSEAYPGTRYGIDAVPMWPRMTHVIPNSFMEKVDQSNNQCSFLLNCCLLSMFFFFICLSTAGNQYFLQQALNNNVVFLISLGCGSLILSLLFYQASLINVSQYGNMIRSTYDLFRFDLLKQLHLPLPKDTNEESDTWKKLSELFTIGEKNSPLYFEYEHVVQQSEET